MVIVLFSEYRQTNQLFPNTVQHGLEGKSKNPLWKQPTMLNLHMFVTHAAGALPRIKLVPIPTTKCADTAGLPAAHGAAKTGL